MIEYIVKRPFKMDFRRNRNSKDRSDIVTLEKGQILELINDIDLLFRIKGTRIGLRLDPWTIEGCLNKSE